MTSPPLMPPETEATRLTERKEDLALEFTEHLEFTVRGKPVGKHMSVSIRNGHAFMYPSKGVGLYLKLVVEAARQERDLSRESCQTPGPWPTFLPVFVTVEAFLPMAKSWPQSKQAACRGRLCTGKPDGDNILKSVIDGIVGPKVAARTYEGILLHDDDQVAGLSIVKRWCDAGEERVEITVRAVREP
jgi:Holliday junction resolvase RusA-like endonuclease